MVTSNTSSAMKSLFDRLSEIGLPRSFIRKKVLPSWWDDECADQAAGYAQLSMLLSRHLGLDVAALLDQSASLVTENSPHCKFKRMKGTTIHDLSVAKNLALQVARIVASAIPKPTHGIPAARDIRSAILETGVSCVSFESLLDYCWSTLGIPVIHVSCFPTGARKMDGLATVVDGRPVIVVSKNNKQPAWLLFILAHELGHLALGHVQDGDVLIDADVDRDAEDDEEREADRFAEGVLLDEVGRRFHAAGRWPNATKLAKTAVSLGEKYRIDPGHIVLNYAHAMGKSFFPVATAALSRLNPNVSALAILRGRLADHLDWSELAEESSEFVTRMTGMASDSGE